MLPLPVSCIVTAIAFDKITKITKDSRFQTNQNLMRLNIVAQALASTCAIILVLAYISKNTYFTTTIYVVFAVVDLAV